MIRGLKMKESQVYLQVSTAGVGVDGGELRSRYGGRFESCGIRFWRVLYVNVFRFCVEGNGRLVDTCGSFTCVLVRNFFGYNKQNGLGGSQFRDWEISQKVKVRVKGVLYQGWQRGCGEVDGLGWLIGGGVLGRKRLE